MCLLPDQALNEICKAFPLPLKFHLCSCDSATIVLQRQFQQHCLLPYLQLQVEDRTHTSAFLCPCDLTPAHVATIFPESAVTTKSQLICCEQNVRVGKLQWSQGVWFPEWHGGKQPPKPLTMSTALPQEIPTVKATDRPTLPQLINFETRSGGINITESIGLHYKQLGPLVLQDNDGTITETIERECFYKVKEIILQRWIQGAGMQPVQWSTLIDVLKKIELSPLAKKIADSLQ